MCGRYSMAMMPSQLEDMFQESRIPVTETRNKEAYRPSNNLGPTQNAPVYFNSIEQDQMMSVLQFMTWGLIPVWTKTVEELKKTRYSTFNARVESISSGNKLWSSVRKQRCVVPVEGYYEWENRTDSKTNTQVKVPHFIKRKDGNLLFLVGFWNHSKLKEKFTGEKPNDVYSFTIITGPATNELNSLHHRIPIILEPGTKEWDAWLTAGDWNDNLLDSLKACDDGVLEWYEVSKDVGKISNDGEYLTKPVVKKEGALDTFFSKSKSVLTAQPKKGNDIKKEDTEENITNVEVGDTEETALQNSPRKSLLKGSPRKSSPKKRRIPDKNQPSIFDIQKKKLKGESEESTISSRVHQDHDK